MKTEAVYRSVARRALLVAAFGGLVACGGSESVIIVYSPHGPEQLRLFERSFESLNPAIDVQWVDMGSQEILDRVRSERPNPQGDVWYGGPDVFFARAAAEGLLEAYRPGWAEAVPPEARGADDLYYGVYFTPAVITFNSDAVAADEAPQDWDEILAPRWKGKVLIRDPLASGTMRTIFGMVMYRSIQETGDTAAGYDWLRRLDGQTKEYVLNPAILYQKLARQEGLVTLWNLPDVLRVQQQGLPLDYVLPASGTPVLVDGIAVIKGSRHPQLAHAFVDYIGSVEGQLLAARQAYRNVARTDLPSDSLPDWLVRVQGQLRPMDLDWEMLEARGREWMKYWDSQIRGSSRR